ncbi:MAG: ABC transporter permease [Anaerolineae bacterium]
MTDSVIAHKSIAAVGLSRSLGRMRRSPWTLVLGSILLTIYLLVAITGPLWAPYRYDRVGTGKPFAAPDANNLLGTDQMGRDLFSRVVYGAGHELFMALTSTAIAVMLGGLLGLLSGFIGGWLDEIVMRLFEVLISIPVLVFALLVIMAVGLEASGSELLLIGVVALVYLPRTGRMARSVAIDLVTRDYIMVARARGESAWSIVWRELLPNSTGVLLVEFGVRAGYAPILIGSLGFLGLGVRPPTPEWGLMISENRANLVAAPWTVLAPALALSGLVISLNMFTDGLARVLGRQVKRV